MPPAKSFSSLKTSTTGVAIFDVGRDGDTMYAVTELLDGTTLRQSLTTPLSIRKAVDIAAQISVRNSYVLSRDGQRFLVNMLLDTAVPPIYVDTNWASSVKR